MDITENHIQKSRQFYKRRRNITRRVVLILCILGYLLAGYKIYRLPKGIFPSIEIYGNKLINSDFIYNFISDKIAGKNFFLVSPRKISKDLFNNIGLIQDLVIRKYVFPELKINVCLTEKKFWAKLFRSEITENNNYMLVTDDGNIVPINFLNMDLIGGELLPILLISSTDLKNEKYRLIKRNLDFISKIIGLNVKKILILPGPENAELEIYCDNNLKIKAGNIDENLSKRIDKLLKSVNALKDHAYMIESIDLTLESGVAVKKIKEPKADK